MKNILQVMRRWQVMQILDSTKGCAAVSPRCDTVGAESLPRVNVVLLHVLLSKKLESKKKENLWVRTS
jgi:hypothetical protein